MQAYLILLQRLGLILSHSISASSSASNILLSAITILLLQRELSSYLIVFILLLYFIPISFISYRLSQAIAFLPAHHPTSPGNYPFSLSIAPYFLHSYLRIAPQQLPDLQQFHSCDCQLTVSLSVSVSLVFLTYLLLSPFLVSGHCTEPYNFSSHSLYSLATLWCTQLRNYRLFWFNFTARSSLHS